MAFRLKIRRGLVKNAIWRWEGGGHFWTHTLARRSPLSRSRCFAARKMSTFLPAATTSRLKLTFPFRSRIKIADADMLVARSARREEARLISVSTVKYGSLERSNVHSLHPPSSSSQFIYVGVQLAAFPERPVKLADGETTCRFRRARVVCWLLVCFARPEAGYFNCSLKTHRMSQNE